VAISVVYALTDEVHQHFVPGRACRLLDVGIDTCGAIFGMCLFAVILALLRKRK
jgi:VanZ family protein